MTILQLKYVIAIDEECSMRKAADRLYVSQPGLSSAVRDLESELGIQIFERVHNGVVTTAAGASFIAYARNAVEQFEKLSPDLVTMDITMPEKNGVEGVKEIMEKDQDAKIVMCSAMGQEPMVVASIKAGAKDFVVKPFQAARVQEAVNKALETDH